MAPGAAPTEGQERLRAHCRHLALWAENNPQTFADKHLLIAAEVARVEGRELDAERLYEEVLRAARENGFVHQEAMAAELTPVSASLSQW